MVTIDMYRTALAGQRRCEVPSPGACSTSSGFTQIATGSNRAMARAIRAWAWRAADKRERGVPFEHGSTTPLRVMRPEPRRIVASR